MRRKAPDIKSKIHSGHMPTKHKCAMHRKDSNANIQEATIWLLREKPHVSFKDHNNPSCADACNVFVNLVLVFLNIKV